MGEALVIVKPETFLKWHRSAFPRFWGWKSRKNLRELIRQMAHDNPTWGEERIANELKLKLGIRVSPRTISKYLARKRPCGGGTDQHPTAEWTKQQFREVLDDVHPYKFVIHDHDSIFSSALDSTRNDFGVRVLRTPVQAPTANAFCEPLIGTIRRECLDFLIPLTERHLRLVLKRIRCFL